MGVSDLNPYKKIAALEIEASKTSDKLEREKIVDEMHRRTIAIIGVKKGSPALRAHIGRSIYNKQGELVTFYLEHLSKPKRELTNHD